MVIYQPDKDAIALAATMIARGEAVGMPTETVYGLAADATSDSAIANVYALKNRPEFNPLIIHVASLQAARDLAEFDLVATKLAEKYWPGPLTLVLPRKPDCPVSLLASAGLDTIAVRVPAHPVAQQLLAATNSPLAAPSANHSGRISPTTACHVANAFDLPVVLDGGPCEIGLESTVLAVSGGDITLLRPGAITIEDIEACTGKKAHSITNPTKVTAPGQLSSHYAPVKPVRLAAESVSASEALLAFGSPVKEAKYARNLSESGDLVEAAANLFKMLHELDTLPVKGIAVMSIPEIGLGIAINDRLRRAAAPRNNADI